MKPGRNTPCPCGSGKKYKHCCGAPSARPSQQAIRPDRIQASRRRHCGSCTACCDGWVRMTVHGHPVEPGQPCLYSTGRGCTIYSQRPDDPCRRFVCGWLQEHSSLPEAFRPDKIGFIVLPDMFIWGGAMVDVVTPAGRDPQGPPLEWLMRRAEREHRPFIYQQNGIWIGYGPQDFLSLIKEKMDRGERLW